MGREKRGSAGQALSAKVEPDLWAGLLKQRMKEARPEAALHLKAGFCPYGYSQYFLLICW